MSVPQTVVPFLERYLREVRPQFLNADKHAALWLSLKGRPLSLCSISRLVAKHTEAAFGDRIPPHRLRHCAASTIAVSAPGRIGLAARLLDHTSSKTTYDHYVLARSVEASRSYAKLIDELTPKRRRVVSAKPK
jgi:site-specific recombinase XerD